MTVSWDVFMLASILVIFTCSVLVVIGFFADVVLCNFRWYRRLHGGEWYLNRCFALGIKEPQSAWERTPPGAWEICKDKENYNAVENG